MVTPATARAAVEAADRNFRGCVALETRLKGELEAARAAKWHAERRLDAAQARQRLARLAEPERLEGWLVGQLWRDVNGEWWGPAGALTPEQSAALHALCSEGLAVWVPPTRRRPLDKWRLSAEGARLRHALLGDPGEQP